VPRQIHEAPNRVARPRAFTGVINTQADQRDYRSHPGGKRHTTCAFAPSWLRAASPARMPARGRIRFRRASIVLREECRRKRM